MGRFQEAEVFIHTVEAGSITGAAEALSIDKSAVSRRLKALETRLGTKLLNRSTRTLSLTDAGRTYHLRAQDLLRAWREMEDDASGAACDLAGPIRIAAPLSFGLSQLGPILIEFQRDHPDIRLDVDFSDRKIDLIAEGFDMAVRIGQLDDSALIARKLGRVEMICAASPQWLNKYGPVEQIEDLRKATELRYALTANKGWAWRGPDGASGTVQMKGGMRASSGDFLRDAAVAGLGVVIKPDFILCDAIWSGSLVPLLSDYEFETPSVYAVWPPTRHMPRRIRTLVESLSDRFGGVPPWSIEAM